MDSNDGFPQSSVLHACLNLMSGEACVLMKQVHKILVGRPAEFLPWVGLHVTSLQSSVTQDNNGIND